MHKTLIAALSFCFLAACGGPLDDAEGTGPEAVTQELSASRTTVRTASSLKPARYATSFVIASTDQIIVVADLTLAPGQHQVRVEIDDNYGNLYQSTSVTVTAARGGSAEATASLPVAGTWIQQYAMAGQWGAHVYVDGAPAESGSVAFTLR